MKLPKRKPKTSAPRIPAIVAAVNRKDFAAAVDILQQAAVEYYGRIAEAEATIPAADAAIVAKLHRHIAAEIERASPAVAAQVKAMEPIELPPIHYQTIGKK